MPEETEAKYAVEQFEPVRAALERAGAACAGTVLVTDTYFDKADRSLLAADTGLRLRQVRALDAAAEGRDTRPEVTCKGPTRRTDQTKTREEQQTRVEDADALTAILAACGTGPMLVIEKRRTTYHLQDCTVELDELPVVGRFVEVEGPDEAAIAAVVALLGLTGEPITDHYIHLVTARCPLAADECTRVMFERCRNCDEDRGPQSRGDRGGNGE